MLKLVELVQRRTTEKQLRQVELSSRKFFLIEMFSREDKNKFFCKNSFNYQIFIYFLFFKECYYSSCTRGEKAETTTLG